MCLPGEGRGERTCMNVVSKKKWGWGSSLALVYLYIQAFILGDDQAMWCMQANTIARVCWKSDGRETNARSQIDCGLLTVHLHAVYKCGFPKYELENRVYEIRMSLRASGRGMLTRQQHQLCNTFRQ